MAHTMMSTEIARRTPEIEKHILMAHTMMSTEVPRRTPEIEKHILMGRTMTFEEYHMLRMTIKVVHKKRLEIEDGYHMVGYMMMMISKVWYDHELHRMEKDLPKFEDIERNEEAVDAQPANPRTNIHDFQTDRHHFLVHHENMQVAVAAVHTHSLDISWWVGQGEHRSNLVVEHSPSNGVSH